MFFTYLFTLLLLVAFILQMAVDQAPDLPESSDVMAARRVMIAGLFALLCWFIRYCWLGIEAASFQVFALMLIVMAEISFCINRLFPEFGTAIRRTALLRKNRRKHQTGDTL